MDITSFILGRKNGRDSVKTQEKTVTPSESEIVVTPDTGYDALSKVTVEAVQAGGASDGSTVGLAKTEIMPPSTCTSFSFAFVYKNKLYGVMNDTSISSTVIARLDADGWTKVCDINTDNYGDSNPTGFPKFGSSPHVEYNGEIHFVGNEYKRHWKFDGEKMTVLANPIAYPDYDCLFVEDGKMYFAESGFKKAMYCFDGTNWTLSSYELPAANSSTVTTVNGNIFMIVGFDVYSYSKGTFTFLFNVASFVNAYLYSYNNNLYVLGKRKDQGSEAYKWTGTELIALDCLPFTGNDGGVEYNGRFHMLGYPKARTHISIELP